MFSQVYQKLLENQLEKQTEGYAEPVLKQAKQKSRAMEEVETGSLLKVNISG